MKFQRKVLRENNQFLLDWILFYFQKRKYFRIFGTDNPNPS